MVIQPGQCISIQSTRRIYKKTIVKTLELCYYRFNKSSRKDLTDAKQYTIIRRWNER